MKHKIQKVELFVGVIVLFRWFTNLWFRSTSTITCTSSRFGCLWYNTYWNNIDF